jgi:DNA-damage-inducible protein D
MESEAIKQKRQIPPKDPLMDRMDSTELAAHQFRMTQAREKLLREGIKTEEKAIIAHEQVGKEVREAIRRIGGTMPEDIAPAEPIQEVRKRVKRTKPKLLLDSPDSQGLKGTDAAEKPSE